MIFLGRLVLKKVFELAVALWVLLTVSFALLKILPGGPFQDETALHPLVRQNLSLAWGLDRTWFWQYQAYVQSVLCGDWGVSMIRPDQKVVEILAVGFSQTFSLAVLSLGLVLFLGVFFSLLAIRFRGSWVELCVDQFALLGVSLPGLFWGPFLIFFFGFYLNLLPVAFLHSPISYFLPVLTLSLRPLGSVIRLLKRSMEENLRQDYVQTAYAKGLHERDILVRHVFRNSLISLLAYLGPLTAGLLSGSFLVEILFSIQGLGSEFVYALNERDYTLILGITQLYGLLLIFATGLCDLLMRYADPRIREAS